MYGHWMALKQTYTEWSTDIGKLMNQYTTLNYNYTPPGWDRFDGFVRRPMALQQPLLMTDRSIRIRTSTIRLFSQSTVTGRSTMLLIRPMSFVQRREPTGQYGLEQELTVTASTVWKP